jgi:hypothetical protein
MDINFDHAFDPVGGHIHNYLLEKGTHPLFFLFDTFSLAPHAWHGLLLLNIFLTACSLLTAVSHPHIARVVKQHAGERSFHIFYQVHAESDRPSCDCSSSHVSWPSL